jgi:uncharacterized integral membrane protein
MAKKKQTKKHTQIGKTKVEKKPLIDPKHKSTFWTILILVILAIFFVINNTRTEPEQGAYPPGYKPAQTETSNVN